MEKPTLVSKFKGATFAALAGDCIGSLYEVDWAPVSLATLLKLDKDIKQIGTVGVQKLHTGRGGQKAIRSATSVTSAIVEVALRFNVLF